MKIRKEHLDEMQEALNVRFKEHFQNIKKTYADSGLTEERRNWDMLHNIMINGGSSTAWICKNLYSYLHDDHVSSALRYIMKCMDKETTHV